MQFFIHKDAGSQTITLKEEDYHYIFRVRRAQKDSIFKVYNYGDSIYTYVVVDVKKGLLALNDKEGIVSKAPSNIHLILAFIDPKDIYELLSFLNEANVTKLSLFYADFSQKNRKLNIEKAKKILEFSCMQCGRFKPLELELLDDLDEVLKLYKDAKALHANAPSLDIKSPSFSLQTPFIIGPEGGFSKEELELLKTRLYSLNTPFILQAQNAARYMASLLSQGLFGI
ncbi:RsmE family RNA methyltransferase [Helicobacter sp. 11S02629-2]|uniref:RsmE family RNA methyltransferase n=1 Tax=Helicobacter sp. 11S02629-2 TaxID=1476195 RepID=UPI000BA70C20|nr:RsmE family RNA methyltransferase [Helicobacter sp. 11S02629-2]PAF45501.1 hypothetical protein BKH40_03300 [Helicobacter sp. 11S02629-2]